MLNSRFLFLTQKTIAESMPYG